MLTRLIGVVFACGGAAFLAYVLRQLWLARASLEWQVVNAKVVETRVDEQRGRRRSYSPVVRYQYEYGGQVYEGDRIIFSGQDVAAGSSDEAKRFIDQFTVDTWIPIRVCPTNATLSVIEPGFDPRWWVPLAFAVMFIFGGFHWQSIRGK